MALGEVVRVAEADPELLRGVPGDAASRLRRSLIAGVIHVDRRDAPPTEAVSPHVFGMLILDGVLMRRVRLGADRDEARELLAAVGAVLDELPPQA